MVSGKISAIRFSSGTSRVVEVQEALVLLGLRALPERQRPWSAHRPRAKDLGERLILHNSMRQWAAWPDQVAVPLLFVHLAVRLDLSFKRWATPLGSACR